MTAHHRLKMRRQLRSARRWRRMPKLIGHCKPSQFWKEALDASWARSVADLTPGCGSPAVTCVGDAIWICGQPQADEEADEAVDALQTADEIVGGDHWRVEADR